jgi:hypothetical protein
MQRGGAVAALWVARLQGDSDMPDEPIVSPSFPSKSPKFRMVHFGPHDLVLEDAGGDGKAS